MFCPPLNWPGEEWGGPCPAGLPLALPERSRPHLRAAETVCYNQHERALRRFSVFADVEEHTDGKG